VASSLRRASHRVARARPCVGDGRPHTLVPRWKSRRVACSS
jgi:hypothetical protein